MVKPTRRQSETVLSSPCCKLTESGLWKWLFLKLLVYHESPSVILPAVQGSGMSFAQQGHSLVTKNTYQKAFYHGKLLEESLIHLAKLTFLNHDTLIYLVQAWKKVKILDQMGTTGSTKCVLQMPSHDKWVMSHYAAVGLAVVGFFCCQKAQRECGCVLQQVGKIFQR